MAPASSIYDWGAQWYPAHSARSQSRTSGGTWWPAGVHVVPLDRLRQVLALSARANSRTVMRLFVSDELEDLLQAAVAVGCACEHLTKAAIATIAPALLADRGDRDSILHASGRSAAAGSGPLAFRSIGATEALKLAKHLHRDIPVDPARFEPFISRNAAAHMAFVEKQQLRLAVVQHCRLVEALLAILNLDRSDYWSPEHVRTVDDLLDEAKTELAQDVAAKLGAARAALAARTLGLSAEARAAFLAALSGQWHSITDHEEPQTCPACQQQGWLLCTIERGPLESETDEDGIGYAWVNRTAYPFAFECPVCDLDLNSEEVQYGELGLPTEVELEPDDDPAEVSDWEPDEDWLRGR